MSNEAAVNDEGGAAVRASEDRDGFARAIARLQAADASTTMRELVERLAHHGADEGKILAEYERVSAATTDPAARYLIDLILSDERRHHQLLVEMATAVASEEIGSADSAIPPLLWHADDELLASTRKLHAYEIEDRLELRSLRGELRSFESTTIWGLLVDLMMLDTEKHAKILAFLEHHARGD